MMASNVSRRINVMPEEKRRECNWLAGNLLRIEFVSIVDEKNHQYKQYVASIR